MESIIEKGEIEKKYNFEEDKIYNLSQVDAFLSELVCGICNNILKNPIECKACEKPICSDCKTHWFQ